MPNPPAEISRRFRAAVRRAHRPDFFFVSIGAKQRTDLERRFAGAGYVFLEPFDLFSSVYVHRAIAPGAPSRMIRRVRAGVRAALGR